MSIPQLRVSREAILNLLEEYPKGLHLRTIAEQFGIAPSRQKTLLAMLDNLVFEGILHARSGESFAIANLQKEKKADFKNTKASPPSSSNPSKHKDPRGSALPSSKPSREETPFPNTKTEKQNLESMVKPTKKALPSFSKEQKKQDFYRDKGEAQGFRQPGYTTASSSSYDREKPRDNGPQTLSPAERIGKISINAKGFGFVATVGSEGDDVYIAPEHTNGAMNGDKVLIKAWSRRERGKEGEVLKILERGSVRVAGILKRKGRGSWVELEDARIAGPLILSGIDARGAQGNSGEDGDLVVAEITKYPENGFGSLEGKILHVLGKPGVLSSEVHKILLLSSVEEVHSDLAIFESESFGATVPDSMLERRVDLTHIPLPTIDPIDARDHDDAVWVTRTEKGGYTAYIAIADVSSYVTEGSHIDKEALERSCSIYLPDRAIPMLPRALSSNLCSLLPNELRLCLCAEVELDESAHVLSTKLHRGFMKSEAKLAYEHVARALGLSQEAPSHPYAEEKKEDLKVAFELSMKLREHRMKRGSLDFDLPEAKIVFNAEREPIDAVTRSVDPGIKKAYQLIEELMLLANEEVAKYLVTKNVPTIFRVHGEPDPLKLEKLGALCEILGLDFDPSEARDQKKLADRVKSFATHPSSHVLNMLLLRAMKQASYDIENKGHFGLASKAYLHFTSPIRRYPDLVVHRSVHELLLGEKIDRSEAGKELLSVAAQTASSRERKAMDIERSVLDLYRTYFMKDRIGESFKARITSFVGTGVFVSIEAPFIDVLIRTEDLGGDFVLDEQGLFMKSKRSGAMLALGDEIKVEIIDAHIARRTIYGKRLGSEFISDKTRQGISQANQSNSKPSSSSSSQKPSFSKSKKSAGSRSKRPGDTSSEPYGDKKKSAKNGKSFSKKEAAFDFKKGPKKTSKQSKKRRP